MDTIHVWEYTKEEAVEGRGELVVSTDLSKTGRAILRALSVFHYLTAEQLSRYLEVSLRFTQLQCQRLTGTPEKEGFITFVLPPKQTLSGGVPYIYTLTRGGQTYLKKSGVPQPKRSRSLRESVHKGGPVLHTVAVNEVLISAVLLERQNSNITLRGFVHEREFAADPLKVQVTDRQGENKTVSLSPDLWLDFAKDGQRYCVCIEMNLTPVEQRRWRERIRTYVNCLPMYEARFGTRALRVATIIETGLNFPKIGRGTDAPRQRFIDREDTIAGRKKRQEDMLSWTKTELKALNTPQTGEHFPITASSVTELTPEELFLTPHWRVPGRRDPVPLLPPTEREVSGE